MAEFQNVWQNLNWTVLLSYLLSVVPALICITFHEVSHGYVAYRLGDHTARDAGRLTLNPIRHIDPMGLLMMVVFKFGWAKPVPVNMRRFKNPKRDMAITSAAGPVSNIVLAIFVLVIYGLLYIPLYRSGVAGSTVLGLLQTTAYLSIALAVFNILPIPPLDGSKVLFSILPEGAYYKLMRYERFGMFLLLALIWIGILRRPLALVTEFLFQKLFTLSELAFSLISKFL